MKHVNVELRVELQIVLSSMEEKYKQPGENNKWRYNSH